MSKKLYVASLSWDTDENSLRAAFEKFGEVSDVNVIIDRDTGRSKCQGFVTFVFAGDADEAMMSMDGAELDGQTIRVNEAKERDSRGGGYGRGRRPY